MTGDTENHISGGVFFDFAVQGRNITLVLPDRPDSALAGLPRRSAVFKGRQAELDQVLTALSPSAKTTDTVVVTGLAGMGKTELVLQAAHRALEDEGWFPGGVLYADLHGYDEERKTSPKQALGTLLRALGIPQEHVPPGIEERALVYRSALSALSAAGRRVLVVLDDVPPGKKIHHLLPGNGDTVTLISSRHSLSELDALAVTLRELPTGEGRELLSESLRTALPEDCRVAAETAEADRIVTLCGGLPLALRILASLLADIPARPLSDLCRDLENAHSRLSVLSRENRAVTAAFELSYRRLTESQAKLFRLMSLQPGPDFSTESAAQLYGESEAETGRLLSDLARRHLVEHREPYGRWRQHSLVHIYSRGQLLQSGDSWYKDFARLLVHFHKMATLARERIFDHAEPEETVFPDRADAMRWLEAERHSLVETTLWAHRVEDDFMCVALAVPLSQFLAEMRYLTDARQVLTVSVRSARRSKDRYREAALLTGLGVVLRDMRKLRKSVRAHRKALKIGSKLNNRRVMGSVLNNLGLSLHEQHKFADAVKAHTEAARLFKRDGDRLGVARALSNVAETLSEMGRTKKAVSLLRRAGRIFHGQGDQRGYAQTLGTLAKLTRVGGKAEAKRALKLHRRALATAEGLFTPHERAIELSNFAGTLIQAGDHEAALAAQQEALDVFRRLEDRHGEAMTLGNMSLVRQREGKLRQAEQLHILALEAFIESDDDYGLASELSGLATTLILQGRHTEALENLEFATTLYHRTGDTERAARTLARINQVRNRVGTGPRPTQA